MNCPVCRNADSRVLDSRASPDGIRRRRQCLVCGRRFTTQERVEWKLPLVVKKDGQREPFEREKITRGLQTACRKRPISAETIEEAVDRVVDKLLAQGAPEVPSVALGRLALDELRRLDLVGYIRFASVYLEFQSPAEFLDLLRPLVPERER